MKKVEQILSDLIKIPSVNPPGAETAVAEYLHSLLKEAHIASEVIEPAPGRGSLIARVGEGERKLLFLSHIDVVPAAGNWDFDPFCGEVREGFILGRGALDCKSLVAAETYALIYAATHFPLEGTLILAATADEEAGGAWGVQYLLEHYPEKLQADFAVNEGGGEPIKINGEVVYLLQTGEKGTAWTRLKAAGVSCHGSIPTLGDNAVVKMARAVDNIAAYQPAVVLIPEVKILLHDLATRKGWQREITPDTVDQLIDTFEDRGFREYLRAITRMTLSPNAIHGGVKTNVVPDSCEADVDIRVLPGQDQEFVERELRGIIGAEIAIEIPHFNPASFSSTTSEHYRLIQDTIREVLGGVALLPCISSGATDSRFLTRRGIPAYGVSLMAPDFDPELRQTIHGRNERIDLKSVELLTRFLIQLARNYLSPAA